MNINEVFEVEVNEINEPNLEVLDNIDFELAGGACGVGCIENI